jgi:putative copper export protein
MSGLLVIATGAVYLLLIYQPLDLLVTTSSGKLILAGLTLVLVALVNGIVFLKPTAMKIAKTPWPEDPNAAIPASVGPHLERLLRGSQVNTLLVVVVLFLMVTAATRLL